MRMAPGRQSAIVAFTAVVSAAPVRMGAGDSEAVSEKTTTSLRGKRGSITVGTTWASGSLAPAGTMRT